MFFYFKDLTADFNLPTRATLNFFLTEFGFLTTIVMIAMRIVINIPEIPIKLERFISPSTDCKNGRSVAISTSAVKLKPNSSRILGRKLIKPPYKATTRAYLGSSTFVGGEQNEIYFPRYL